MEGKSSTQRERFFLRVLADRKCPLTDFSEVYNLAIKKINFRKVGHGTFSTNLP